MRPEIRKLAETAKKELSLKEKILLKIPNGESFTLKREEFENLVRPVLERTILPCKKALRDAGLKTVDNLVLVGGMTKMPLVRKISEEIFKRKPLSSLCPDESVAQGAAIQGAILAGSVKKLLLGHFHM